MVAAGDSTSVRIQKIGRRRYFERRRAPGNRGLPL